MKKALFAIIVGFVLSATGCASSIVPPALQHEVKPDLSLSKVKSNPAAYKDQVVLWGGRIIKTINKKKGTLIEVLQLPLDQEERPKQVHDTEGRFIVSMSGFLDPEVYQAGKDVTVVARVAGMEELPLGEITYTYVLLRGKEVYLWPPRKPAENYPPYPPVYFYGVGPGYWYNAPYMWW